MNRQLKIIMKERYGKFVLIGVLLIACYYLFLIQGSISGWYETRSWNHSEKFRQEYRENPDAYVDYWDDEKPVYYTSIEEYIKGNSYLFFKMNEQDSLATRENKEVEPEVSYGSTFRSEATIIFLAVFFIVGFLLFFVDLKTNFNTFLFSLGVTRTEIFIEKLKTVAIPLFSVLLLCKLAFIASFYLFIPHEFINVHLSTLLLTLINGYIFTFFFFTCGVFIGILTGNLLFGPVIAFAFFSSTLVIKTALVNYILVFESLVGGNLLYNYFNYNQSYLDIGKSTISVEGCIALAVVSLVLLFISWRAFHQLSLEKSSQNLLLDGYRLPISILIIVYSCFLVWGIQFVYSLIIYPEQPANIPYFVSRALISGGMISLVTVGTIYFTPIKKRIRLWQEKRRQENKLN